MKTLKWSRFNFLFEISQKRKVLYNSYTNILLKLNDDLYAELQKLSHDKCNIANLEKLFSTEELTFLTNNYILVENDESLVELMQHQSMSRIFDKTHLVLTISPTQNCNFNCNYCYEKWRQSGSMTDETEDALIAYLKDQKVKYGLRSIDLTWYGGEPLLEYNRIKSLGEKINDLGIEILEKDIITNGYMLDEKRVKILVDVGIKEIQITLDGFKHIHDKRRPLLSGKGTFDQIIRNLDNYFKSNYKNSMSIVLRVNIDQTNKNDYLSIYNWLKERYPYNNVIIYPGWIHLDENDEKKCNCFSRNESTDFCLDLCKNYGIVSENMYPEDINVECLVRNPNSIIIGWQGEIYKCFEDLGNEELIVGNLHNQEIWNNHELIAKYSVGIDHFQDKECRMCSYLPICHGGCPLRRLENKYEGKSNDCCTPFKGRLKEFLDLQYEKIQCSEH